MDLSLEQIPETTPSSVHVLFVTAPTPRQKPGVRLVDLRHLPFCHVSSSSSSFTTDSPERSNRPVPGGVQLAPVPGGRRSGVSCSFDTVRTEATGFTLLDLFQQTLCLGWSAKEKKKARRSVDLENTEIKTRAHGGAGLEGGPAEPRAEAAVRRERGRWNVEDQKPINPQGKVSQTMEGHDTG
ncbi:unnamed protein product [Pleuronectes platessa]|uniref:Uncharacterized protein n=1 Tax=Pleuronectes platessa TaxID=8262 RepID=A0A9N7YEP9_PLEPL|nr:unnamed protein product [Pleuronectes platessa]